MAKRDYYEVLGISKDAGEDEIRKAYRRMARRYHPDVNRDDPQAAERFKEVQEAYEVLGDDQKRAAYDRFGHAGVGAGAEAGGFPGAGGGFGDFSDFGDMGTIFEQFFGGMGGGFRTQSGPTVRAVPGADIEARLTLSFEEAAFGADKELRVRRLEPCPTCSGSGSAPGTSPARCSNCGGSGQVRAARQTPFGQFVTVNTCGRCRGTGEVIEDPCVECMGRGQVRRERTVKVKVPAGVDSGDRIRLRGEGDVGQRGGPPGDLLLTVNVKAHPRMRRDGTNVLSEVSIGMAQAALGTTVEIETLDGPVEHTIAPGTQPGTEIRLRGKGIPRLRSSGRGDHIVTVKVAIPSDLSEEERNLLAQLAELRGELTGDGQKGFFQRVKDAFNR